MLESEARTKWCPMVRLIAVASNGATMLHINRDNDKGNRTPGSFGGPR